MANFEHAVLHKIINGEKVNFYPETGFEDVLDENGNTLKSQLNTKASDADVTALTGRVVSIEETLPTKASASQIPPLQSGIDANAIRISDLEGKENNDVQTLTGDITANAAAISGLATRMGTAETNITNQGNRLSTAEADIDALQDITATHTTQIADLREINETTKADLEADYNAKIQDLKNQVVWFDDNGILNIGGLK